MVSLKSPLFFCLILIILNIFDVITTVYGLSIGGSELNHIFPPATKTMPIKIALPFLYLALFYLASKLCNKEGFKMGLVILKWNSIFEVVFYFAIIVNNLIGIIFWGIL